MLAFLRLYLYWAVLWGFLVHPALGLRDIVPGLLLSMDLLMMAVTGAYVLIGGGSLSDVESRHEVRKTNLMLAALIAWGLLGTALNNGSLVEGAKYLAVLVRPMLVLLALFVCSRRQPAQDGRRMLFTIQLDLAILVAAQLAVATLQLVDPVAGADFIGSLDEQHSAVWALADGDVSGTFANSIDLSYFLVAAYVVFCLPAWQRRRPPSLLLSALMVFYVDATGSLAATACLIAYIGFLVLRCLGTTARRWIYVLGCIAGLVLAQLYQNMLVESAIARFDDMMLSRLGLIFISVPGVLAHMPAKLLSGMGTDFTVILGNLNALPDVPLVFTYDDSAIVINDVFWVAMTLSLGLPVVVLYLMRAASLLRRFLRAPDPARQLESLWRMLLVVILLAGLLNQILLIRSFTAALFVGLFALALAGQRAPRER